MTKKSNWFPILKNKIADQVQSYLDSLDKEIFLFEKRFKNLKNPKYWLGSLTGASLYFLYRFEVSGDKRYLQSSESMIVQATDTLGKRPSIDALYSGFTGLAWVIEYYRNLVQLKVNKKEDPNKDIDDYLVAKLKGKLRLNKTLGRYGLVDELVGYGIYGLERWPRGQSPQLLNNLVKIFKNKATYSSRGTAWFTLKEDLHPNEVKYEKLTEGYYNLGLAHGIPGIIGLLSGVLKAHHGTDEIKNLLRESVKWFLSVDNGKNYDYRLSENLQKMGIGKGRLAWCYCDLGVAPVLVNAGRVLKDKSIEKQGLIIAKRAAALPEAKSLVGDPFFCHGSSGNFHIFNRLYQSTGDPRFKKASLKWAANTLKMLKNKKKFHNYPPIGRFEILMGFTGVGLSLLSGISEVEPGWDRFLLLS